MAVAAQDVSVRRALVSAVLGQRPRARTPLVAAGLGRRAFEHPLFGQELFTPNPTF
jgi:hypothetical protein